MALHHHLTILLSLLAHASKYFLLEPVVSSRQFPDLMTLPEAAKSGAMAES
jgi:hypothetical protein